MFVITVLRLFLLFFFGFILTRLDLRKNIIPDKITFPLIIIGILFSYIEFGISKLLIYSYLIILGTYFFYLLLYLVLKRIKSSQNIGGGDVKYSLAIASLIPFQHFFLYNIFIIKVIFISFILVFVMAIIKIISLSVIGYVPNKLKIFITTNIFETKVAFAPLLFISSIIAFFV